MGWSFASEAVKSVWLRVGSSPWLHNWYSQLSCVMLSSKWTTWSTSRQVYSLHRWKKHLTARALEDGAEGGWSPPYIFFSPPIETLSPPSAPFWRIYNNTIPYGTSTMNYGVTCYLFLFFINTIKTNVPTLWRRRTKSQKLLDFLVTSCTSSKSFDMMSQEYFLQFQKKLLGK